MPTNLELRKLVNKLNSDLSKVAADSTAYSAIVSNSGLGAGAEAGAEAGVAQGRYFDAVEIDAGYSRTALSTQGGDRAIDLFLGKPDPTNENAAAGVAIKLPTVPGEDSMSFFMSVDDSTFENGTAAYVVADAADPQNFLASESISPTGGNLGDFIPTDGVDEILVVVYMFGQFGQASNVEGARLSITNLTLESILLE